jgi:FAD:protein FMN transferase
VNVAGRTDVAMGTLVTIQVTSCGDEAAALDRASRWFYEVESRCARFDPERELVELTARVGVGVRAGAIPFEALRFASMAAEASGGAFDRSMAHSADGVSHRDVTLDRERKTIMLRRPSTFDLGRAAKGQAVDTGAREWAPLQDFAIDAGVLYPGGSNEQGSPWRVGVRHARNEGKPIGSLQVSNQAVCTSGDYGRPGHIFDPRTEVSAEGCASVTLVAADLQSHKTRGLLLVA